jgi:hypothetical protein
MHTVEETSTDDVECKADASNNEDELRLFHDCKY